MSSYQDKFHADVQASLQSQELQRKKVDAFCNTSMFTLYYSQGARISAIENLRLAKKDFEEVVEAAKEQAIICSNLSINLCASAAKSDQYVKQAVTNASGSASNIQVASNAIVRLASDMGAIFSILSAADYGSMIYEQAKEAYECMNDTAYNAEIASQHGMEATMLTSEISSATVADKAKALKAAANNILDIVSAQYDSAFETIKASKSKLATLNTAEKLAEGSLKSAIIEKEATDSAYAAISQQLNLNLHVNEIDDTGFTVQFDLIRSPFPQDIKEPNYPVSDYYLLLVKDAQKAIFSITAAEELIQAQRTNVLKVNTFFTKSGEKNEVERQARQRVNIASITDTDDDKIELGTNYAVLVVGIFHDDYKKKINNFDEYMSAPSAPFSLTHTLKCPDPQTINVRGYIKGDELGLNIEDAIDPLTSHTLRFSIEENKSYSVEYRCMFLPCDNNTNGLLTESSLKTVEDEVESLEEIAARFDPEIARLESELNNLSILSQAAKSGALRSAVRKDTPTNAADSTFKAKGQKATQTAYNRTEKALKAAVKAKEAAIRAFKAETTASERVEFFFNAILAAQVSPANYLKSYHSGREFDNKNSIWIAFIDPSTTDNFGNRLVEGKKYKPVILSVYSALSLRKAADSQISLSDFNTTAAFIYSPLKVHSTPTKS